MPRPRGVGRADPGARARTQDRTEEIPLTKSIVALAAAAVVATAGAADARDQVRAVGSSTAFPYTQAVAEEFASTLGFPSPVVESTGTGGGMKVFCAGVGEADPDITGASAR